MSNLTSVTVTSGVPTAGTGTVSTIDNLIATGLPISNGANTVAIKAASTVPLATDPALVVAISPNGVNPNGQTTMANSSSVTIASDQTVLQIGTQHNVPAVALVVTASSAYTAGNCVGGLITFGGVARGPNNSGLIQDATLTCKSVQTSTFDLYLFNQFPSATTFTNKSAVSINVADVFKLVAVVPLDLVYSELGTHSIYKPHPSVWKPVPFQIALSGTTMYGVLVCGGTPTFSVNTDLTISVGIATD